MPWEWQTNPLNIIQNYCYYCGLTSNITVDCNY